MEPIRSQPTAPMSTLPAIEVPDAGHVEQRCGMEDVGAEDLAGASAGRGRAATSPKKTPVPTDVRPTTTPHDEADQDRGDPVAFREHERQSATSPRLTKVLARKPMQPKMSAPPRTRAETELTPSP